MPTEAEIKAALGVVIHPTYGMSLVALQMVKDIRLSSDRIEVDLVMNCPGCPAGEAVLARTRQILQAFVASGDGQVNIRLLPQVWQPPWQSLFDAF